MHLLAAIALLCAAGSAAPHGGLSMEEDYCKLRVGRFVMHFVGYQPDSPSGPKEFCEDIPETGRTVVVLDYVDDALRDLPTEVRVIRDTGSEADLDAITIAHLPAQVHPTGSLHFELDFLEPGRFVGLVSVTEGGSQHVSRFPFAVGRGARWWHFAAAGVIAAAAAIVLYRLALRRRSRARHSSSDGAR